MKRKSSQAGGKRDVTDVNIRLFYYFLAARELHAHQDELDLWIDSDSVTAFSSFHLLHREGECVLCVFSFQLFETIAIDRKKYHKGTNCVYFNPWIWPARFLLREDRGYNVESENGFIMHFNFLVWHWKWNFCRQIEVKEYFFGDLTLETLSASWTYLFRSQQLWAKLAHIDVVANCCPTWTLAVYDKR